MKLEEEIGELLKAKNLSLSTAESCTGGGIAALITSVPGSSEYFNGGIVAYSNEIKQDLLHVSAETLPCPYRRRTSSWRSGLMKEYNRGQSSFSAFQP